MPCRIGDADYERAAMFLGYCILGHDQFVASVGVREAEQAEACLYEAIAAGDSLDAKLVLLTLHSRLMAASVADRFDVETD